MNCHTLQTSNSNLSPLVLWQLWLNSSHFSLSNFSPSIFSPSQTNHFLPFPPSSLSCVLFATVTVSLSLCCDEDKGESALPVKAMQLDTMKRTKRRSTDMAFHIIQAQHSSSVIVVGAFVFLLHASAQLVLDHLKMRIHPLLINTLYSLNIDSFFCPRVVQDDTCCFHSFHWTFIEGAIRSHTSTIWTDRHTGSLSALLVQGNTNRKHATELL